MTNQNLENIAISDEPKTGLKRVIDLNEFSFNRGQKYLKVEWKIYFLDVNNDRIENTSSATPPYTITTYASDSGLVNPATGAYVGLISDLSDEDQVGLMGEYSFFLAVAETPIEIYPLLVSKAAQADGYKRFDK